MAELTREAVTQIRWGDAEFLGFYWDSGFEDPTLVVRVTPANASTVELVCRWASELKLQVDYRNNVGSLLTWGVVFAELPESGWRVTFDLASHGSISVKCLGVSIRPVVPMSAA